MCSLTPKLSLIGQTRATMTTSKHSLDLFMGFLSISVRILIIVMKNSSERSRKDEEREAKETVLNDYYIMGFPLKQVSTTIFHFTFICPKERKLQNRKRINLMTCSANGDM